MGQKNSSHQTKQTRVSYRSRRHKIRQWLASLLSIGLLLILPLTTMAQGLSLLVNGKSVHLAHGKDADFNETNTGTGLQYEFSPTSADLIPFITAGGFKDSVEQPSYYVGVGTARRLRLSNHFYMDASLVGFLMTREDYNDNKPFPGLLPMLTLGTQRYAVNMTYIPKSRPTTVPLFFIQLKVSLAGS